jgi:hypothetical protein
MIQGDTMTADVTRRTAAKMALAAAVTAQASPTKAETIKKILAVAIGDPNNRFDFRSPADSNLNSNSVRPYIRGVVSKLTALGRQIGSYYMIEYREFEEGSINFSTPDLSLILCLSTTVAKAANDVKISTIPVVAICSDPDHEKFTSNFFGVSAARWQKGKEYFNNFLDTVPSLQDMSKKIYVLHKKDYYPSEQALNKLKENNPYGSKIEVVEISSYGEIESKINGIAGPGGLLILPADWFFAKASKIFPVVQSKGLPDFWPVTDWVKPDGTGAVAGYGVSQLMSGEILAQQIDEYWKTEKFPTGKKQWLDAPDQISWMGSVSAAGACKVSLGFAKGLIHV